VRSLVDTELPEDDLFAGIAGPAGAAANGDRSASWSEVGKVSA
jgi:hypothetical protein